ncbi:MAG TPA: hypothetical protein VE224_02100 [Pseudolabrys sp.]|nr:hypothetical protein [Pseudolabrys sp.]
MRKLSSVSVAIILAISVYFMLAWGFEALRMLTSPTYGLDEVWRSQFVFAIGSYFHLSPVGLIKLAAFFATLKLAVAVICAVHVFDRFRSLISGTADSEILEAGLILVVAISILSVGPAVWSQNAELVRESTVQLSLAALAAAFCMLERSYARRLEDAESGTDTPAAIDHVAFDTTVQRGMPRVGA